MVMITGQKGVLSSRQARFQVVDVVASMKPLTKLARQIVSPQMIPTTVREAFRIAQEERPGPVHLELPEDIAAEECQEMALDCSAPTRAADGKRRRTRSCRRAHHRRETAAAHVRRRRLASPLDV